MFWLSSENIITLTPRLWKSWGVILRNRSWKSQTSTCKYRLMVQMLRIMHTFFQFKIFGDISSFWGIRSKKLQGNKNYITSCNLVYLHDLRADDLNCVDQPLVSSSFIPIAYRFIRKLLHVFTFDHRNFYKLVFAVSIFLSPPENSKIWINYELSFTTRDHAILALTEQIFCFLRKQFPFPSMT